MGISRLKEEKAKSFPTFDPSLKLVSLFTNIIYKLKNNLVSFTSLSQKIEFKNGLKMVMSMFPAYKLH